MVIPKHKKIDRCSDNVLMCWCALLNSIAICGKHDFAGGSCADIWGQEMSPRGQQLTTGSLTPPATQGMSASTFQLTPASHQGSSRSSLFFGDDSNAAGGVALMRCAGTETSALRSGMYVSSSKRASRLGGDTTALANALSGMR